MDQVWKENIDLQIFEKLMEQCNICNSEQKMRYIKFISDENASLKNLNDDGASTEKEKEKIATGGNAELLPTADQMFLETTV